MGIQGLLPLLKSIMMPIHIKDLKDCCVAVDTYSWLHKGALSCSKELCKGLPTTKHIEYCMHRVNMLRHYGVKPILVFDGGPLPMKSEQENKRARSRRENLSRAIEHESNGNPAAAYECYQKAVDISPSIAYDLIQVLKQENVCYVVAPYEADAQMTFLAVSKQVDAVITEDSDLIAFGCPRIIYKMDKFGQGVEFRTSLLQQNKDLNLIGFTKQMLLEMCILSGCDYLQSLPGMGLKKAHTLMKKFKSYDKVLKHLKYNSAAVSPLYEESFRKAMLTFQHQRVYDPLTEEIIHLSEPPNSFDGSLDFLGPSISNDVAKGIAKGDIDPFTKMPFEHEHGGAELAVNESYQLKNFKPEGESKKLDLPAQKNLLTNYFCFASVEAKRKYIAPRLTPMLKRPNPENGIFSSTRTIEADAESRRLMTLTTMLPESVDCTAANKASELLESRHHGVDESEDTQEDKGAQPAMVQHSVCKPCSALHKESTSDQNQSKLRTENTKMIVRSSYFLHKDVKETNQVKKKDRAEAASNKCGIPAGSCANMLGSESSEKKISVMSKNVIVRSSYFKHKSIRERGPCDKSEKPLVKESNAPHDNNLYVLDEIEVRATTDQGNATGRSFCFQHSSLNKYEKLKVDDQIATDTDEYSIPDISLTKNFLEDSRKKRKITNIENAREDARGNDMLKGPAVPMQSDDTSMVGDTTRDTNAQEGKFGCNISHLGHYSDIAEKSMEKFASVISSFKFTSNGSRASGLRAPLKDVKNTCRTRSSSNMDLSKFAYAPSKKTSSTSRRL
nr:exonuclease 1 isoform X1 [Coffea arabica]